MTDEEALWLGCHDPEELIDYHSMKGDKRRLRLLAVACVRRVLARGLPPDAEIEGVLVAVERYADGGERGEFLAARKVARRLSKQVESGHEERLRALLLTTADAMEGLTAAISFVRPDEDNDAMEECQIIRDLFHPYAATELDPTWRTETVLRLAQAAYDLRPTANGALDRDLLLVLADALEDAGATAEILEHFRSAGPHARGCHYLDLVLGRM